MSAREFQGWQGPVAQKALPLAREDTDLKYEMRAKSRY